MKRMKVCLVLLTLVGGIGGAMASKYLKAACEDQPQYIRVGGGFEAASADYACVTSSPDPACTYYRSSLSPLTYTICKWGTYVDLTRVVGE